MVDASDGNKNTTITKGDEKMGWTGCYIWGGNPKGKERIEMAIRQEGYNFTEGNRKSEVIDSALVGNTVYMAVHFTDTDQGCDYVYGAVILTSYHDGEFCTKGMSEFTGPYSLDCPKRIMNKLSPTTEEYALEWRRMVALKREQKKAKRKTA